MQALSHSCSLLLALMWHCVCLWIHSLATKDDQEAEAPDQTHSEPLEEASDAAAPPESESSRESHSSDSDSDGPILYTDDDDDDDDDNASAESKPLTRRGCWGGVAILGYIWHPFVLGWLREPAKLLWLPDC